ncbi:MAG: SHOCT domain-containing protein [Lachnospiraceae bacterium]|nr:SHOCT domain-containing protein [Lachnospiraceae bacterium]
MLKPMIASIVMVIILLVSILVTIIVSIIVLKRIKKVKTEPQQTELLDSDKKKMAELFVSAEEKYISSLGNGYFLNFLSDGAVKKAFAFISDKRVYFRGNCYTGRGKALLISEENRTVDIKDVTGSGFIYKRRIGVLVGIFAALLISLGGLVSSLVGIFYDPFWHYREQYLDTIESKELYGIIKESDLRLRKEAIYALRDGYEVPQKLEDYEIDTINQLVNLGIIGELDPNTNTYTIRGEAYKKAVWHLTSIVSNDEVEKNYSFKLLILDHIPTWSYGYAKYQSFGDEIGRELLGAVCLPLFISCLIVFINYLKKRKTFFQVQYAGGSIAFDVSYYAKAEIEDFQKQLRRVKDLIEEASAKSVSAPVTIQSQPIADNNGTADELRKYADLLKDGLISQEDYDAMKKKLLGL